MSDADEPTMHPGLAFYPLADSGVLVEWKRDGKTLQVEIDAEWEVTRCQDGRAVTGPDFDVDEWFALGELIDEHDGADQDMMATQAFVTLVRTATINTSPANGPPWEAVLELLSDGTVRWRDPLPPASDSSDTP